MINVEFTEDINDLVTENLYQWDTYQTLKISGINFDSITPRVHFANKKSKEALVVKAILKSDGTAEVSIPNSLLTEKYDILAYIYTNTGLTYKTIKSITIPVISRLKPSEYFQPTDEQIVEIEEIELHAKLILNGLYASEYNTSESYIRHNVVYYNHSSYMCISDKEITGVLPTDTSKWQMIADGAVVTSLTKDSNGNIIFNFSNGSSFTVEMAVKDAKLVDGDDVPALKLTSENVANVKNITSEDVAKIKRLDVDKKLYRHNVKLYSTQDSRYYELYITIYNYSNTELTKDTVFNYTGGTFSASGFAKASSSTTPIYSVTRGGSNDILYLWYGKDVCDMPHESGFVVSDNVQEII